MNIAQTILAHGDDAAPAILSRDILVTYREVRFQSAQTASGLLVRGHTKGNRVGIMAENSPFFVTAYLGIISAGLVAVPLPTDLTEEGFGRLVCEAGIQDVLVSQRFANRIRGWAERAGVTLLQPAAFAEAVPQHTFVSVNPCEDLAALMFTSGSTGKPKGVMVTHRNIECNTRDIIAYMQLGAADRVLAVLPFYYCFGISLLHTHLMAGASLVLNNDFKLFPETVLQDMERRECTGFAGVPSTYQLLLRKSRFREMSLPKLRWLQQAGGKLPDTCIQEIRMAFPIVQYFLMYGQTEATARLSYLPPERLQDKLGSIGRGLHSTRLEVLKPDGSPVLSGSEETGEIVASGENISKGYWNDPEETARYFKNGRLHTGDIARVDSDGFIFVVERERDLIKSGGNRVSAKEVEEVIAELSEVVEVAVIGKPHDLLGEAITAFVVLVPSGQLTEVSVKEHCRKRLPGFKMPEEVVFLKTMPHNGSGKILKPRLKEMLLAPPKTENLQQSRIVPLPSSDR